MNDLERGQLDHITPDLWQNDTSVAKNSWGYTIGNDYKKPSDVVLDLIDVVSKNGALLLNIGPKPDGTIPEEEIKRMIAESYDLVTDSPTKRIYEAVKRIPKGHVATYGKIAEMAGDPRMARAVGNALHKNPDPEHIPCFRVVNAKGELAGAFAFGGEDVQAELLRADGVEVINGRVDLGKYGICV